MITGSIVYSRRGQKAAHVTTTSEGHIVRPFISVVYGDGEDHEEEGELTLWTQVYTAPPTEALHAEVVALGAQIERAQEDLNAVRAAKRAEETDIAARKARLTTHESLALLDHYLAGRITHYVTLGEYRGPCIIPVAEALCDSSYTKEPRLLSLYGWKEGGYDNRHRKVRWKLSRYSDGSGSSEEVFPCCSLEEARAKAGALFEERWAELRGKQSHAFESTIEAATKLGFPVPPDLMEQHRTRLLTNAQHSVDEANKALTRAQAAQAKAKAELELSVAPLS